MTLICDFRGQTGFVHCEGLPGQGDEGVSRILGSIVAAMVTRGPVVVAVLAAKSKAKGRVKRGDK